MRRAVCASVLDHLLSRQPTGRPELDGFADVAQQTGQTRRLWDFACDRMTLRPALPRYAGWERLCRGFIDWTSPASGLLWLALGGSPEHVALDEAADPADEANRSAGQRQLEAMGAAFAWIDALTQLPADWRAGRLLIALDDLHAVGLTDRALGRWLDALSPDATDSPADAQALAPPAAWGPWVRRALARVDRIMAATDPLTSDLPSDSRLALHVLWRLQRRRLAGLEAGTFEAAKGGGFWRRLVTVPGALTQAARIASPPGARLGHATRAAGAAEV